MEEEKDKVALNFKGWVDWLHGEDEGHRFIKRRDADIEYDATGEPFEKIGYIMSYLMLGELAGDLNIDFIVDEADAHSQEAYEAAEAAKEVAREVAEDWPCNFLYVARLYIEPKYRNRGIGAAVVKYMVEQHHFCSFVLLNPVPFEGENGKPTGDPWEKEKLVNWYEQMEFINTGDTDFMARLKDCEFDESGI